MKEDIKEKFIREFRIAFNTMKIKKKCEEIAILCVGTDKIIGDSFGPIVGTKLCNKLINNNFSNINVYGNLERNINYENIKKTIKKINNNTGIIIIDAALSNKENIGKIFISNNKTILGKGLNKNKISIGDISVKSVVAKNNKVPIFNFRNLQKISLNTVMSLADIVSDGIYEVVKTY